MYFCYGEGSNGKSVFLDTIKNVVGSYGLNTQPETVMTKKKDATELGADVARLKGARFVSTVETSEGSKLNESLIKQMTGEDDLVARFLYGKPFEFKPEFKIWMATNHRPIIRGTDNGIWRRVKLIPFKATFSGSQVDKDLKNKLNKELSGILNWAIEGCIKWQTEEYTTPNSVQISTKEYRKEMDILEKFIDEVLEKKEPFHNARVKSLDLFKAYTAWAKEHKEYEMSSTIFGREMSKKFEKVRSNAGQMYLNIQIKDEFQRYLTNYRI
jgi:putative DNA primase/helicase